MEATQIRSAILIFIVSLSAVCGCGCSGGAGRRSGPEYRPVLLSEAVDPLAPPKDFPAWRPPRQFAVWIHPHEDPARQVLVGGHWMMLLLSPGSWYIDEDTERDPVPDAEATGDDIQDGLSALHSPGDAVVPYRKKDE